MATSSKNITPEQVASLEQELHLVKRKLNRAKAEQRAAEKDQARRDDTRRKVIAGALALEHFEKNPGSEFGKKMFELLDEYTRPDDRHLFAFLPVRGVPLKDDQFAAAE